MHVVKKFDTSAKLVEYLNGGKPVIEGTGDWTQSGKTFDSTAITTNTLSDFVGFNNTDGSNTSIHTLNYYIWISGRDASGYADKIANTTDADTIVLTTDIGADLSSAKYRIVPNKPIQTSDIFTITVDSSNLWVLIHNVEDKTFT